MVAKGEGVSGIREGDCFNGYEVYFGGSNIDCGDECKTVDILNITELYA